MTEPSIYVKAARALDKKMVEPLRQLIIGRSLYASTVNVGPGIFNIDYPKITESGVAITDSKYPDPNSLYTDMIKTSISNQIMAVNAKSYVIPRGSFNAFATKGWDLQTEAMLSAMQQVGVVEDAILFNGWAPATTAAAGGYTTLVSADYQIRGFLGSALANSRFSNTAYAQGTFGNSIKMVQVGVAALFAAKVYGVNFNLSLDPVSYMALMASVSSVGYPESKKVMELLNPYPNAPKGGIYQTLALGTGTSTGAAAPGSGAIQIPTDGSVAGSGRNAVLTPVDESGRFLDLVISEDAHNIVGIDERMGPASPIYGLVLEVLAPRIKQANTIYVFGGLAT